MGKIVTAEPGGFTPIRCDSRHKESSALSCTDHSRPPPYFVIAIFLIATSEYDFYPSSPHSPKLTPYEDSHTKFLGRVSFLNTLDLTSLGTSQNHRVPF